MTTQTETTQQAQEVVTSKQLAERLGVTRRSVKRYTALGLIEPESRKDFTYLWDFRKTLERLHEAGRCKHVELP